MNTEDELTQAINTLRNRIDAAENLLIWLGTVRDWRNSDDEGALVIARAVNAGAA